MPPFHFIFGAVNICRNEHNHEIQMLISTKMLESTPVVGQHFNCPGTYRGQWAMLISSHELI